MRKFTILFLLSVFLLTGCQKSEKMSSKPASERTMRDTINDYGEPTALFAPNEISVRFSRDSLKPETEIMIIFGYEKQRKLIFIDRFGMEVAVVDNMKETVYPRNEEMRGVGPERGQERGP